jgi:hypothetical protein
MTCQCDMAPGGKACHCRACCLTFSGPAAFDKHLLGWQRSGRHRAPQEAGLTEVRPGVWGKPDTRKVPVRSTL